MMKLGCMEIKEEGVPYNHDPQTTGGRSPYDINYFDSRRGLAHYGSSNSQWAGGFIVKHNRVYVSLHDHWASSQQGYVKEHILVMESLLGRRLWSFEDVRHRNGDMCDNYPDNLELVNKIPVPRSYWTKKPKQFAVKVRTDYNTPPFPFRVYDYVYHKDKVTKRIELWVGAICKWCGKPYWQNMFVSPVLDHDRICRHCADELEANYESLPYDDAEEWRTADRRDEIELVYTVSRYGHLCLVCWGEDPSKIIGEDRTSKVWKFKSRVDNSTTECIVKDEYQTTPETVKEARSAEDDPDPAL